MAGLKELEGSQSPARARTDNCKSHKKKDMGFRTPSTPGVGKVDGATGIQMARERLSLVQN